MAEKVARQMLPEFDRSAAIDELVDLFPRRTGLLVRVIARQSGADPTQGASGILAALEHGARSVTQLAHESALAQPTASGMISRLEALALVTRRRTPEDRRVVLVELTRRGHDELEKLRTRYRDVLLRPLLRMSDEEIADIAQASRTFQRLIEVLREM